MTLQKAIAARIASKKALTVRGRLGIKATEPVNAFDIAERLDVEVRFVDIPSMEGMYIARPDPVIVLSSLRPLPRQLFTCAHEIGHHILGHGDTIDSLIEQRELIGEPSEQEYQADTFASHLLMPPTAVDHAFASIGRTPNAIDPHNLYLLSSYFSVGYSTLARHLQYGLKKMNWVKAAEALQKSPRQIRQEILGSHDATNLIYISEHSPSGFLFEAEEGDVAYIPSGATIVSTASAKLEEMGKGTLCQTTSPGLVELEIGNHKKMFIRVAKKGYVGRLVHRYSEVREDD